jgi:thioredoxin-like negative regulator of GroEL
MPVTNITSRKAFNSFIKQHPKVLCLYYWKVCGHCIDFVPIWNDVIRSYKDRINVAQIELEYVKKLDDKYKINAFPTILIYKNGEKLVELPSNNRTEAGLHNFITTHLLPTVNKSTTKNGKIKKKLKG